MPSNKIAFLCSLKHKKGELIRRWTPLNCHQADSRFRDSPCKDKLDWLNPLISFPQESGRCCMSQTTLQFWYTQLAKKIVIIVSTHRLKAPNLHHPSSPPRLYPSLFARNHILLMLLMCWRQSWQIDVSMAPCVLLTKITLWAIK